MGEMFFIVVFFYGLFLGVFGFVIFVIYINMIVVFFVVFGYIIYVGLYSFYMKWNLVYGILVGSFFGVVLFVVGYCVVSG